MEQMIRTARTNYQSTKQQLIHSSYGEKIAIGVNRWLVHRRLGGN
jgi:hypothetical protein